MKLLALFNGQNIWWSLKVLNKQLKSKTFVLKYVQGKLDMVENYRITQVSSLYHICKENCVNLSYTACHEKH